MSVEINREKLFEIAKSSILQELLDSNISKPHYLNDSKKATFVTLMIDGNLRGCVGSIVPVNKLSDDIWKNSKNAAFNDPRFEPLSLKEIKEAKELTVEISILTQPKQLIVSSCNDLLSYLDKNKPGLIMNKDDYFQSTFLPDVWSQLPDSRSFLDHLAQKAGYNSKQFWQENPLSWTYYEYYTVNKTMKWDEIII
ncbi:MAG: AmmeMemoRadiSam system protein A [Candidatus Absconditabacteria bacterium]